MVNKEPHLAPAEQFVLFSEKHEGMPVRVHSQVNHCQRPCTVKDEAHELLELGIDTIPVFVASFPLIQQTLSNKGQIIGIYRLLTMA